MTWIYEIFERFFVRFNCIFFCFGLIFTSKLPANKQWIICIVSITIRLSRTVVNRETIKGVPQKKNENTSILLSFHVCVQCTIKSVLLSNEHNFWAQTMPKTNLSRVYPLAFCCFVIQAKRWWCSRRGLRCITFSDGVVLSAMAAVNSSVKNSPNIFYVESIAFQLNTQ